MIYHNRGLTVWTQSASGARTGCFVFGACQLVMGKPLYSESSKVIESQDE